ncbi:MAG TPA: hypothetical protein ENH29_11255 [Bacteroidetes bacterium]|nr:hypothetical protein [Bacteroidota bacterium]
MQCKMNYLWSWIFTSLFLLFSIQSAAAQKTSLLTGKLPKDLKLDGRLTEPAWFETDSISNLTMIEPEEGKKPSNRTVVKVLANAGDLVFGFDCRDRNADGIVAYSKSRDAELRREDNIRFVLDTFMDGRSGYVFAINPLGARYDGLVSDQREGVNSNWDAIWEAKTYISRKGWSAEVRIPIKSLSFKKGITTWGFNVERRIQRLQETDRWAGTKRDYKITQTSQSGRLEGLPDFNFGLGLHISGSTIGGAGIPGPGMDTEFTHDINLDVLQKMGPNMQASLTVNTDFAETEVDARQTNITRFPLFFPEKRTFFLEGADIFEFGLGLERDIIPYFSRRIGLMNGQQVPIKVGGKVNGRIGNTNMGALVVRSGKLKDVTPGATVGVVRIKQNILRESSVGIIATTGDPHGSEQSWLLGFDMTYKTSKFRGDKNFVTGIWGLLNHRENLTGDQQAYGFKIDYPNDLFGISLSYKRIGADFQPSLGFVPRVGINSWRFGFEYDPRPSWKPVRQMFHEFFPTLVTGLNNQWESYRVFMAPVNWRLESGDRFEFNIVPQGENLFEPFVVTENTTIPNGRYHWMRYRLEGGLAAKRKFSGQLTWWFGEFYSGKLDQIELTSTFNPSSLIKAELSGEVNYGRLPEGNFTQRLIACRISLNFSPDLQISSFIQYDNESDSFGINSRLRWTFNPLGDLFIVYNHNLVKSVMDRWNLDSNQLLIKLRYGIRI